jgi:hypothetical protein
MDKPKVVDVMGRDLRVGDMIVYPVRRKSDMVLKKAVVSETPGYGCVLKQGIICLSERGRRLVIERPERCAIVSRFEERNNAQL